MAAASALRSADMGRRALVMSTDAAHSLSDSFDIPLGGEPTLVAPNLWGQETELTTTINKHWSIIQEWASALLYIADYAKSGEHDPIEFFYQGKAHYIEKEDDGYTLSFDLPYTSKEEINLTRSGDELIIRVGSYQRNIILPRTLANLQVKRAKFENKKLVIRFEEECGQGE